VTVLQSAPPGEDARRPHVPVSAREAEVLARLGRRSTNAEIAAELFISVRTVESHVSSLLRKYGVTHRRELADLASAPVPPVPPSSPRPLPAAARLPRPLTPFIGRSGERVALAEAVAGHRLVTAVGPGGIGKTRLALSVAEAVAPRFRDGVHFVDLVPLSDPDLVGAAVAQALAIDENRSRSAIDAVLAWLRNRQALLVLDNCEHLVDGVVALVEQVLAGCPDVRILATSRAKLLVPYEWVYTVPGLAVRPPAGGRSDAVTLFLDRAAAAGAAPAPTDEDRVSALCRSLDGSALAIELAAARLAAVGLDGLEAGLGARLHLLAGGPRLHDRHRSLRSTLDWSHDLLDEQHAAVLRRVAVFGGPFSAAAAGCLTGGWGPVPMPQVPAVLAALADRSLLVTTTDEHGTRYRFLETVRQYALERLEECGEAEEARTRHLGWCLCAAERPELAGPGEEQRIALEALAAEVRAALGWAEQSGRARGPAGRLATRFAQLCFASGRLAAAQRRYEQAARLATDPADAAEALRAAAGAAAVRHVGDDSLRLGRAAAAAAIRAGDAAGAAADLARTAELIRRAPGLLATIPPAGEVSTLLAEARALMGDDPAARARVTVAEAYDGAELDPRTAELTERGIGLAGRVGDRLAESAALDRLTGIQLAAGRFADAAASARRRTELLGPLPIVAANGLEFFDAYTMAADCAVGVGDLPAARRFAEQLRDLPFHREEGHLAGVRLLLVAALDGEWDEATRLAGRFRDSWERAGRPRAGNLSRGAYAAAAVFGLRGDDRSRGEWLDIAAALTTPGRPSTSVRAAEVFEALVRLHRGEYDAARAVLDAGPEHFRRWYDGLWRPWHVALAAEAAALAGAPDAGRWIDAARPAVAGNRIAEAVVGRAAALGGNRLALRRIAAGLRAAGGRYQWARTLVLMGGAEQVRGAAVLQAMGAAPMALPGGEPAEAASNY
jgi:predicted ATPase/DNA-binding CsgD family transcriptional regulator